MIVVREARKKGEGKEEYNIQEGIEIESNYTQN